MEKVGGAFSTYCVPRRAGPFKGVISFNPHHIPASGSGPHFTDKALRGEH